MWIIPTASRPKQCAEMLANLKKIGTTSKGIVFVNGTSHAKEYENIYVMPENFEMYFHPENLGSLGALNHIITVKPNEPFYGFIGDDEMVHIKEWDTTLINAAGNWCVSHANDMWQSHLRIHSHVCIGGNLARSLGYLAIQECWHWYGFDNMWEELCNKLGLRRWCPGIRASHKHHLAGLSKKDECYFKGESRMQEDLNAFREWKQFKAPALIAKIKKDMEISNA